MSHMSSTHEQRRASSYQLIVGGVVHNIQDTSLPGGCLRRSMWQSALFQSAGPDGALLNAIAFQVHTYQSHKCLFQGVPHL